MSPEYETIEKAIAYLKDHYSEQPDLDTIAASMNLSPFHFQRMFSQWAGVSPKKFIQFLNIRYARELLRKKQHTLFNTALETGLSGTSRLHDLFISIEGMSPADYKNGGAALTICYSFQVTAFGRIITGSTATGICHLAFFSNREAGLTDLALKFPAARLVEKLQSSHLDACSCFIFPDKDQNKQKGILRLHLKGTPFQLKVWEALLTIPCGDLTTYSELAAAAGNAAASRAVGSAVGANPVAWLIPCHRVIRATGILGEYHWGPERKQAMIGWEAARLSLAEPQI